MDEPQIASGALTQRLIDRLCHDIAGSIQALTAGLDLLRESSDQAGRDEAADLLADAVASQQAKLAFARRAFGSAPAATDCADLEGLARGMFTGLRPTLDWAVEARSLGPTAARCLLNVVQIASEILAVGGVARIMADASGVTLEARGPRVNPRAETRAGLAGEPLGAGLAGKWVQAALIGELARAAGGTVAVDEGDGAVTIRISLPPGA